MLLVNVLGLALIALIVWWFWLYKESPVASPKDVLVISVENGVYEPAHITLSAHAAHTLTFIRKDKSPCAETVLFPDLEISETLPIGKAKKLELPPMNAGSYAFHCQMNMYKGQLHVEVAQQ
ncbi:cupredoxin domain-containing protein [Teredinibacter turnerae]|uniref:cupredoxin domain-containing protein n=1 Tax=Teredinibacter turnerae TaxID=2426 RepID=UPI00037BE233|nr:cupredoxin domain-containing protein [Teredinibacter turnerae]